MKVLTRIAAAALIGLGIGAIDASAQNAPVPPAPPAKAELPSPLTAEQMKVVVSARLIQMRSDLKVGKVTEKDADTYDVELLKADGAVAEHALVDKIFGRPSGALQMGRFGRHPGFGGPGGCAKGGFGPAAFGPGAGQR